MVIRLYISVYDYNINYTQGMAITKQFAVKCESSLGQTFKLVVDPHYSEDVRLESGININKWLHLVTIYIRIPGINSQIDWYK